MLLPFARTFIASLLLSTAAAVPLKIGDLFSGDEQKKNVNASSTVGAISQELLNDFKLMAQFSAAAYCADNDNVTFATNQLECLTGNCDEVQALGIKTVLRFLNSDASGNTGYVALDNKNKKIMLVFRGSHTLENWLTDLDFLTVESKWCKDCRVHGGFWKAWSGVAPNITNAIDAAYKLHPDYRVAITGHSLGAALATLAAGTLRQGKPYSSVIDMYNFGSPRVGNKQLAAFLTQQAPKNNFRVTALDDPVPQVPPHALGFDHITPEYWMFENPLTPAPKDIKIVNGYYSDAGNSGSQPGVNKTSHGGYFGRISKCSHASSKSEPTKLQTDLNDECDAS